MPIIKYIVIPILAFFCQWQLAIFVKDNYISKAINSESIINFLYNFGVIALPLFIVMLLISQSKKLRHNVKIDYVLIPVISTIIATIIYHTNLYQSNIFSSQVYSELLSQAFIFYIACQVWFSTLIMLLADFFLKFLKSKKQ